MLNIARNFGMIGLHPIDVITTDLNWVSFNKTPIINERRTMTTSGEKKIVTEAKS